MIGIEVSVSHKDIDKKCLASGLMTLTAVKNVLRILPPLTITYAEIDKGLKILHQILKECENQA
jgi:acetylornithine/N-succinyldiaminopimelate aminotransferase